MSSIDNAIEEMYVSISEINVSDMSRKNSIQQLLILEELEVRVRQLTVDNEVNQFKVNILQSYINQRKKHFQLCLNMARGRYDLAFSYILLFLLSVYLITDLVFNLYFR